MEILRSSPGGLAAAVPPPGEPWAGRRVFPRLFGMLVKQFTDALNGVKLSRIEGRGRVQVRQNDRII
jgi:hypothetical protein